MGLLSSTWYDMTFHPLTLVGPTGTRMGMGLGAYKDLKYGDRGLDDHPNPLINNRRVFTIQNKLQVHPTVQFIRMGAKP